MPGSILRTAFLPRMAGRSRFALAWMLSSFACLAAGAAEPIDVPPTATAGVLIMRRSGDVVAGMISQTGDSYIVYGLHGKFGVPASEVRLHCATLHDAYLRLHELTLTHRSANSHLTLAKWCVTNQLDNEAIQELKAALELEPDRGDIQRMLETVTEALKPGRKSAPNRVPENAGQAPRSDVLPSEDAATLGGLSLSQALHYTRRIQPMLVKTCATTGCHTRESQHGFQLYHVIPGKNANRHSSELNLAAVLEYIDLKKPAGSRLLTVPRSKHGRVAHPVFSGPRGEEQFAELEAWVVAVARDAARRGQSGDVEVKRKSSVRQAAASELAPAATRGGEREPFAAKTMAPATPVPGERRERKMSDSNGADPFDPANFNRQSKSGRAGR